MGEPFTSAFVGFVVTESLKGVIKSASSAYNYKELCNELAINLRGIEPIVAQLEQRAIETKHAECIRWLLDFEDILAKAGKLTNDCSKESRLDKTKRMLNFWRWKKLPSQLAKLNTQIDKAMARANLLTLDIAQLTNANVETMSNNIMSMDATLQLIDVAVQSSNVGNLLGFAMQATPSLVVGVEDHFNKVKTSILQSYGRMDGASTFGLQGSGGAGKTLLAQMLNNDPDIKETYGKDSIVWISVGLDASVGDLYERMAKCSILDSIVLQRLKLLHNREDQRMLLLEVFSKEKVLLILDDVWEKQEDHHDMMYWLDVAKGHGSATLITTRSEPVLQRARAEVNVVLSLNDDDSWKLFSSHAFVNEVASLATIPEALARAICNECKGLPLALKVIGSTMMERMYATEWESALLDLQQSTPILQSNVDVELFGRLQLSYKELKNDATRICFLYFASFPEDHKIKVEKLINIWVGEELFGRDLKIEVAKRKAYDHLRVLVKRSLIDWNEGDEYAHVHDILRDLALYIMDNAKLGECAYECLFYSEKASISFPRRERIVALKRMSFINCKMSQWPEDLLVCCPKMKVCIFKNTRVMESGSFLDFLKNMVNLRVLDLSCNSFFSKGEGVSITNFVEFSKFTLLQRDLFNKLSMGIRNLKYLTELDLSGCGSLRRLPKKIDNLKCLLRLNLSECVSLRGLPKTIGNLRGLMELDLRECLSMMALPKSIGNLVCLTKLSLTGCESLTGLPETIGNFENLMKLHLRRCKSLTWLPESIGNLKCLTGLDLSGCESLTGLPETIGNLKCLTELYLTGCKSLTRLPESIGNLKRLIKLNLQECESLTELPESIGNLKCLTELYLYGCKSLTGLPESIGNLKRLIKLNLQECESLTELPKSIGNLKCLTELYLYGCKSLTGLPVSIGNLVCLTELYLTGCKSLTRLPESIGNLERLIKLNLQECESLTELPKSIGNLKCLTELYLYGCKSLTGLPESIGNLKRLIKLNLQECESLTELPKSIGNLKCLTELYLYGCKSLTGLPESIGNLVRLIKLKLQECESLTELPKSIGNLKCLTELYLYGCKSLTGLPESIGNLVCRTELYLTGCKSLTVLPESIGNLVCLTELYLIGCKSLTVLPETIGNLERLIKLDLDGCKSLTGLPKSIGNLERLIRLDLQECESLTELPESIGNLKCLTELDLDGCKSLTRLPESIGNLEHLISLDLQECKSLTELPESIGNLEHLIRLHLQECESLTELPESIGNLKCLTKLDLDGCKSLTGLPKSIGNLEHLI